MRTSGKSMADAIYAGITMLVIQSPSTLRMPPLLMAGVEANSRPKRQRY